MQRLETSATSTDRRILFAAVFIATFLLFWNLGSLKQFSRAEVYFAEVAREMCVTGDWITPRFCDQLFFDKPPLTYWLIAICFRMFGFSETVARIPSAFAGIATVILVILFAGRHYGHRAGALGGLVLTTSLGFWAFARFAMSDALLTLFVTGAMLSYWEGLRPNPRWKL